MGTEAVGAYLQWLREYHNIPVLSVSAHIGISPTHVYRIEQGKNKSIGSDLLMSFARLVRASVEDIANLMLDETALASDGKRLAQQLVEEGRHHQVRNFFAYLSSEQFAAIVAACRQMPPGEESIPRLRSLIEQILDGEENEQPDLLTRLLSVNLFRAAPQETQRMLQDLASIRLPPKPLVNIYKGVRTAQPNEMCNVLVNDEPLLEALGRKVWVDFEWGFSGSGPSQLAQAIMEYEYGFDLATDYARPFLFDVVANLPGRTGGLEWVLSNEQIHLWLILRKIVSEAHQRTCG